MNQNENKTWWIGFVLSQCYRLTRLRGHLPAVILLSLLGPVAVAEPQVEGLTPYLQLGTIYDSNLFRLTNASEAEARLGSRELSDQILRLGGGFDFQQLVSAQELGLKAEAFSNQYSEFDFLDHTSGLADAHWNWRVGSRWDGSFNLKFERELQDFDETKSTEKDLQDKTNLLASGRYSISQRWQVGLTAGWKEQSHSLESRESLDREVSRGEFEVRYKTPSKLTLGYKGIVKMADFQNQDLVGESLVDNSYEESENSLVIDWALTVHSKMNGRIGYTKREYDSFSERDFSGYTWQFKYRWRPKDRFHIKVALWRDLEAYSDSVTSHVTETGFFLQSAWLITPKATIKADISRKSRDFDGDPELSSSPAPVREDDVTGYGLSAEYALLDKVNLNLSYLYEERDSNTDGLDFDYYNVLLGVNVAF